MKTDFVDLGLLCQVVGRKLGVEVIERPDFSTFATDGQRVFIPARIAGDELDAEIMRGGIAHEAAGHIRHTNFKAVAEWIDGKGENAGLAKALENIIEDARIEKAAIRDFPGCRKMLSVMIERLEQKGFFSIPDDEMESAAVLRAFLLRSLREQVMHQPISAAESAEKAEKVFGKPLCDQLLREAVAGANSSSTSEVLSSVDRILSLLGDAANPPPPPPESDPSANGKDEGDGGAGDPTEGEPSQSSGEEKGAQGSEEGSESPGGAPGKSSGNGAGKEDGEGKQQDKSSDVSSMPTSEQSSAAARALVASSEEIGKTDIGEMVSEVMGAGAGQGRTENSVRLDRRFPATFVATATASNLTTRLRSQMEVLLQSRVDDEDPDMEEHGRLNPRLLARARLGDKRVFQIEGDEGEGLSSAIHILVDGSGSMNDFGNKDAAAAIIYALSSAMASYESQGVRFALSSFNGNLMDLKRFEDPWVKAKNWIGNYGASGGTMFTGAVRALIPELSGRKERRKTLFVITDGDTGISGENRKVCQIARKEGIDVDVLCVGDNSPTDQGFRSVTSVSANDPVSLQKAIFATLKKSV